MIAVFLRNHEWQGPFQRKLLMFDGKVEKLRRNSTKRRGTTKLISAFVWSGVTTFDPPSLQTVMVQQLFYVHFGEILLAAEESETTLSNCFVEVFKMQHELECSIIAE
jgi:hypothetical protein